MMSSPTTENTSAMPINNRPTFQPNKHYYYYKYSLWCVKIGKKTKSGKSIWIEEKYHKIRHNEKGEFIIYKKYYKVYAKNAVFTDEDSTYKQFEQGFANVLQKVDTYGQSYTNFILQTHYFISMCKFGPVAVGFIVEEEDTPTAKDYAFQILETVEEFKQEISDSNYKTVVDLLQKIHNL
jgi:hypothetical protein